MTAGPKKWIVGLDLGPRSSGAIHFAKWLANACEDQLVGVHVLEEAHLRPALRYHALGELQANALTTARAVIEAAGATADFAVVEVIEGHTAEDSLAAAAAYRMCHGIVIGRNAPRDGRSLVRLGRVARRLLRTLPAPIAVVPPDLDLATACTGPVVLACSLDEDGAAAAAFARELATRLGRGLELVHVAPMPDHHSAQYLPPDTLAKLRVDTQTETRARLNAWAQAHGLGDVTAVAVLGTIIEQVAEYAESRDAAVIVTGSRRLSGIERLLLASAGSELAAHARRPVFVVPPV